MLYLDRSGLQVDSAMRCVAVGMLQRMLHVCVLFLMSMDGNVSAAREGKRDGIRMENSSSF